KMRLIFFASVFEGKNCVWAQWEDIPIILGRSKNTTSLINNHLFRLEWDCFERLWNRSIKSPSISSRKSGRQNQWKNAIAQLGGLSFPLLFICYIYLQVDWI